MESKEPKVVRCRRDGHTFIPKIKDYPGSRRYFDCPKCGRGYFLKDDGKWRSDREIEVVE